MDGNLYFESACKTRTWIRMFGAVTVILNLNVTSSSDIRCSS